MNTASPDTPLSVEEPAPHTNQRFPWRRALLIALLLMLLLVGYVAVRSGIYGWRAYQSGMALLATTDDGISTDDLPQMQAAMGELHGALVGLEGQMRPMAPLLRGLRFIPTYGPTIAAAPELLLAGREMTAVGDGMLSLAAPALAEAGTDNLLAVLPALVDGQEEAFGRMADHAAVAAGALMRLPAADLHPILSGRLQEVQPLLPAMAPGLRVAPALPSLLGMGEARTYLLLMQNNHELRGTGGFLTAVGELTILDGKIAGIDFQDSYSVRRNDVDHAWAPPPMQRYMGIDLLFLQDANWSPDFPTSAQTIRALYAQDAGKTVDGVITVDLHAVELVIDALGTLQVPGTDQVLTGETIIDQIKEFWGSPLESDVSLDTDGVGAWWRSRKDFMPQLAQAALARVQAGNIDYLRALRAGLQALDERAVQLWMVDPAVTDMLNVLHWDGGLAVEEGADYLALVDSNMGYNKVDSVLERSLDYQLSWPDGPTQPAQARAAISYQHPVAVPDHRCEISPRYGTTYDEMTERCYFDYVRLYAPAGSELLGIDGLVPDTATTQRGEAGTQVFAGYFVLEPGQANTVVFHYRLPAGITPENYRLVLQRQAGVAPYNVSLSAQIGDDAAAPHALTPESALYRWAP